MASWRLLLPLEPAAGAVSRLAISAAPPRHRHGGL